MKKHQLHTALAVMTAIVGFYLSACSGSGSAGHSGGSDSASGKAAYTSFGSTRTSTSNMVFFGNVTKGCSGKGVCNAAGIGASDSMPGNIATTFWYDSTTPQTLNIAFVKSTLLGSSQCQSQCQLLNPPAVTSYSFDLPYDVSVNNPLFNGLKYPTGTIIPAGCRSILTLGPKDSIVNTVTVIQSTPVVRYFILGNVVDGKWTYGIDQGGTSILGMYTQPRKQIGDTPAATKVTFSLAAGDASTLMMNFNQQELMANENSIAVVFWPPDNNGSGGFIGNFALDAALAGSLGIPANSWIPGITVAYGYDANSQMIGVPYSSFTYCTSSFEDATRFKKTPLKKATTKTKKKK